jgi:hypothetical protein
MILDKYVLEAGTGRVRELNHLNLNGFRDQLFITPRGRRGFSGEEPLTLKTHDCGEGVFNYTRVSSYTWTHQ